MPTRLPSVSRRVLLAGSVAGAAVVAGCTGDALDPDPQDPTLTPSSGAASPGDVTARPEPDDDAGLVAEVLAGLAVAHRTARANARVHPDLAPVLRRFERLHTTHAAELGDLPRATGRVSAAAESPAQVRARVERTEAALQRVLVDAATAAGSGALAQTFASMAAGVAQLRTTL